MKKQQKHFFLALLFLFIIMVFSVKVYNFHYINTDIARDFNWNTDIKVDLFHMYKKEVDLNIDIYLMKDWKDIENCKIKVKNS